MFSFGVAITRITGALLIIYSGVIALALIFAGNGTATRAAPDAAYLPITAETVARLAPVAEIDDAGTSAARLNIRDYDFRPGTRTLYLTTWDGALFTWAPLSGEPPTRHDAPQVFNGPFGFSADGARMAYASAFPQASPGYTALNVWDIATNTHREVARTPFRHLHHVELSADGSGLAAAGFQDGAVRVWDVASGQEIAAAPTSNFASTQIQFLTGDRLGIGVYLQPVTVWNVAANARDRTFGGWHFAQGPGGTTLLLQRERPDESGYRLADLTRRGLTITRDVDAQPVAFGPYGDILLLRRPGELVFAALATGDARRVLPFGGIYPAPHVFSSDGRVLVLYEAYESMRAYAVAAG